MPARHPRPAMPSGSPLASRTPVPTRPVSAQRRVNRRRPARRQIYLARPGISSTICSVIPIPAQVA
eukprot:8991244-Pyramimonas_sp.AAC.1